MTDLDPFAGEDPAGPPDVSAYLARIGCEPPASGSLEALRGLQRAHTSSVPFENLDILLGRPIRLDLPVLFAKIVTARRGGYCFEQNTLFAAVLDALGFAVTPLAARVRLGATDVRPRAHMLLRVEADGASYAVDVGFGAAGPRAPLPLAPGEYETHSLRREGEQYVLEGDAGGSWGDLYAFTLEPQFAADFEMANWYASTYPDARFVRHLVVQRPDGGAMLFDRELTVRDSASVRAATVSGPDELLDVLALHFDLHFPPGTRFSRPAF